MPTPSSTDVELQEQVIGLMGCSVAASTKLQYECGFQSYCNFMRMSGNRWQPNTMPNVSEDSLMSFAAHCNKNMSLKHSTIKSYICGIRFKYLSSNLDANIFSCDHNLVRLQTLLTGIKKTDTSIPRTRLPLTFKIVKDMVKLVRKGYFSPYIDKLFEAACITAFFGFLRCGEFTVKKTFCSEINLCFEDVTFIQDRVVLRLKVSKTDPFRKGVDIHLFRLNSDICPMSSLKKYVNCISSPSRGSPFFVLPSGEPLTRQFFISSMRSVLSSLGFSPDSYNGHSFRIGAATSAASRVEDHMIKTLGRWTSSCYTRYIRTPLQNIQCAQIAMSQT